MQRVPVCKWMCLRVRACVALVCVLVALLYRMVSLLLIIVDAIVLRDERCVYF